MISFKFNEKKTTQIVALFIKKHGERLNYTKLIKLLYLTDREALSRWERSLTGDSYVSMPKGPVLSRTYDLINYEPDPNGKSYWYEFISKSIYDVSLAKDPGIDELSKRELDLIDEIFECYKDKTWGQMIPLQIEDILRELKKTEKEIELINEETSNLKYFDFIMPSI
jgi:hypothetical protein